MYTKAPRILGKLKLKCKFEINWIPYLFANILRPSLVDLPSLVSSGICLSSPLLHLSAKWSWRKITQLWILLLQNFMVTNLSLVLNTASYFFLYLVLSGSLEYLKKSPPHSPNITLLFLSCSLSSPWSFPVTSLLTSHRNWMPSWLSASS